MRWSSVIRTWPSSDASADPLRVPAHGTFGVLELPSCKFRVHAAATGHVVRHRTNGGRASGAPAPRDEAKDDRAYRHHEQQMNEPCRNVERKEAKHPQHEENDCDYPTEIHGQ